MSVAIAAWMAGAPARADAPAVIPLQGTLAEADGGPVHGVHVLRFAIHDSETGGTPLWTETQDVVVTDGMLSTLVGESQPLDLALFRDNGVLWMEIAVDASPPFPRMQLATTPYAAFAQYAGDARSVGGVAASGLARTGHEHDDRYYTETELGAAGSASVHWGNLAGVPAGFADGADDDTTYSAGLGLMLTGTRFSADPLYLEDRARAACYDTPAELQAELDSVYAPASHPTPWTTLTGVPAGFADGMDNDTTYSAGAGLSLSGVNEFAVRFAGTGAATTAARSDHAHDWASLTGVPAGFADGIDNTGLTAALVTIQGPGLGDFRNNSSVSTAGTWWTIPNRTLAFTKQSAGSRLRITYQDTLGTYGQFYAGCEWRILLDGAQIAFFSDADLDGAFNWRMNNASHVVWATATAGARTIVVQNRGNRGAWGAGTSECLQGWNTTGNFLSVEEIP